MKVKNVRTLRRAIARGSRVNVSKVPEVATEHRKGTSAAKAATVFKKMWPDYVRGDAKRKELVERAAKTAKISAATASTYLHNFAKDVFEARA